MILTQVLRSSSASSRTKVQLALVAGALVIGTAAAIALAAGHVDPIAAHPAPPLFSSQQVSPWVSELAAVRTRADRDFAQWARAHPGRDDAAFTAFVLARIPPVPAPAEQRGELSELRSLAAQRTPAGTAAADWLEVYGKADIWKLYLDDATETVEGGARHRVEKALDADLAAAQRLSAAAQKRFARPAPSAVEPGLRKHPRRSKLSYPSGHAVDAVSALVVLSTIDPGRARDFQQMAAQVMYSRLYAAGHYRSDLLAGAYVGALLGDYESRALSAAGVSLAAHAS